MKRILKGIFILLLLFLLALPTWAEDSAQQTVSFQVEEIYSAYFPDEVSFILDTFTWQWYQGILPILDPDEVTHYYNLTVTRPAYLKARILNNMEEFRLLTVNASVPSGKGISYGEKELNYFNSGYPKPAQTLAYIFQER